MGGNDDAIGERKAQHLDICADASRYDVEGGSTMLEHVRLLHRSLPELDARSIDTRSDFLDRTISMPVFISSMTGGSTEGYRVNKVLARIAQEARIPVGMGSIRILFRKPEVIDHFMLKRIAPDVPVFANIGGVQLVDSNLDALTELVARLEVDAVAVHLNPGQELAQPEGDRRFDGVIDGIARLCDRSPVPVIVKETGFGIGAAEAHELVDRGVRYVDVAGSGGTNWVTVEGYRMAEADRAVAAEFADWGTPTAIALAATRDLPGRVLASGGLRTGMDVAKSIALGAQAAGLALPFVRAVADGGFEAGLAFAERLRSVLRATMTLTGSPDVASLRSAPVIETSTFTELTNLHRAAEESARDRIRSPASTPRGPR
jgi:isopentenyl-diphosphate Delta-isomerase